MKKEAPLAFRIPSELKRKLKKIADEQQRSVSQVCEILLWAGVEEYDKGGIGNLLKISTKRGGS
jgi:hypothetical protein